MSYSIVYSSRTGNTALLAQAIREALPQEECSYFGAPHAEALGADTIYVVLARALDMDGGMTHEVPWKVCPDWGVLRVNRHFRRACRRRGRLTVLSHMVVVFQRRFRM